MNDWVELDVFLQKYEYTYINESGVMFNRVAAGMMFVDSPWPGFCIDEISLVYLCNDASEFFNCLEIKNAEELDQVRPDVLLTLFHAGEVILVCSMSDDETLEFQMHDGKLVANKENNQVIHIVKENLETAEDFIEYTKQYFMKFKEKPVRKN